MNNNAITLASYQEKADEYVKGTRQIVTGDNKDWLDRMANLLKRDAEVLELGSGFGRDATYLESLGYKVICSDAVSSFIEHLRKGGHVTKFINVLEDSLEGPYDAILANMVFLHFDTNELVDILANVHNALKPSGLLAFSVRRGEGSEWSNDKLGAPRYYKYWSHEDLKGQIATAKFDLIDVRYGDSTNPDKIYVVARCSPVNEPQ